MKRNVKFGLFAIVDSCDSCGLSCFAVHDGSFANLDCFYGISAVFGQLTVQKGGNIRCVDVEGALTGSNEVETWE